MGGGAWEAGVGQQEQQAQADGLVRLCCCRLQGSNPSCGVQVAERHELGALLLDEAPIVA